MINVIGLGYIGLPTAIVLAASGNEVVGTDIKENIIDRLNDGFLTFQEKGMDELFSKARKNGIKFESKPICTDVYIISVPTPYNKVTKKVELSFVLEAVTSVMEVCYDNAIIIVESTIPPRTFDRHIDPCVKKYSKSVNLVHAPERIIPGNMVNELVNNSRIIGADNREIGDKVKRIYQSFCKGDIVVTDIKTAEMSKVVENTYRDINIAFANELAKICREAGVDVYEVIRIANMHPRVNILQPGPGVGGHCISVDPWFLVGDYPKLANLVLAARKTNDSMPVYVLSRIYEVMKENNITDISRVGLYGLTYKENVDDVRESPTLQLLDIMDSHLAMAIKIYDPMVERDVVKNQYHDFDSFLENIDFMVVMVGHSHLQKYVSKIKTKIILDTRNVNSNIQSYKL